MDAFDTGQRRRVATQRGQFHLGKGKDRYEKDALMASRGDLIGEDELGWLIADHRVQRRLCALLEQIADELPDLPSEATAQHIGQELSRFARRHLPLETELFIHLCGGIDCPSSERTLHEVRQNHAIDALHADDLSVELRRLSGSSRATHPGELAYMLRCFFDGCRRAMAFEELALLSIGREKLTPAARQAILQSFAASSA
jgi:hypothetical protein